MKTRRGWLQGYNAQIVVTTGQIIIANDVTTDVIRRRKAHGRQARGQSPNKCSRRHKPRWTALWPNSWPARRRRHHDDFLARCGPVPPWTRGATG